MESQNERALRRKKREFKKKQQSIALLTILMMLITAGVVHAQVQGYEIFYQGQSLGTVKSASVFEKAVSKTEEDYQICFENEDIVLGQGFEMVPTRIDMSMDVEACLESIRDKNIELYVNGLIVLCDNQVMGTAPSSDLAQRLVTTYESLYPGETLVLIEQQVPLSKSSDFETIFKEIQKLKAE